MIHLGLLREICVMNIKVEVYLYGTGSPTYL